MSKRNLYEQTTDKFVAALEAAIKDGTNLAPWQQDWHSLGRQQNLNSKRPYRGFVNQIVLIMAGYGSPYWATYNGWRETAFKQWIKRNDLATDKVELKALKSRKRFEKFDTWIVKQSENIQKFFEDGAGGVNQGEKSTTVIYWDRIPNKKYDENDKDSGPPMFFFLKSHSVFNIEQTTGIEAPKVENEREFTPIEAAEQIWENYEGKPELEFNGGRAVYNFVEDKIGMPKRELFKSDEGFYQTLFHEAVHSTGHESRLGRDLKGMMHVESYSKEELIAEMGGAMLLAQAGVVSEKVDENSVKYLRSWISKLKDDPKLIVQASTKCAAACDLILGVKYNDDAKDKTSE